MILFYHKTDKKYIAARKNLYIFHFSLESGGGLWYNHYVKIYFER